MCRFCENNPVISLNNGASLCSNCFVRYFERKAKKTIAKYDMIEKKDTITVALSGGKSSSALLCLLASIARKHRSIKLIAITIDEGISGYSKDTLKAAKDLCKQLGIEHKAYSFKKEFGYSLDEMTKRVDDACTVCSVLRRYLLNKYSRELGAKRLATGHSLNNEAQSIIMNQFRSNVETAARLGPVTGVVDDLRFVRRIKPFYLLNEKEISLYAQIKNVCFSSAESPYFKSDYRSEIRRMLDGFEKHRPDVKNNIVNSFLAILPLLKEKNISEFKKIRGCSRCGEPSVGEVCNACEILERIRP